ncbi:MAG: hypothetical protein LBJ67_01565 [Planctomycetaceae bacterium]|jgi:hypothetical protein|nr:hypothetical protein [Planctomycetaceae bacterium]
MARNVAFKPKTLNDCTIRLPMTQDWYPKTIVTIQSPKPTQSALSNWRVTKILHSKPPATEVVSLGT